MLPEIGAVGQEKLGEARITIIGAGGLGSPVSLYLCAAGVGHLRLIDDDTVSLSNLNRQILHSEADIGRAKVDSARDRLTALNSGIDLECLGLRLGEATLERCLAGSHLIIDCLDNFPARYLVNDFCFKHRLPFLYAGVRGWEGRLALLLPGITPCFRCLVPSAPDPEQLPVIGVTPGVIGSLVALEAIKFVLSIGTSLVGQLLIFDGLRQLFRLISLEGDPHCPCCAKGVAP
jgi:molybdopterin/thiamine biosynthesis adenylyltransferase